MMETTMKTIETNNAFENTNMLRHSYRKADKTISKKNDYTVRPITSKVINQVDVNGTMFMIMYDRCNEHTLSILDMTNDGYYASESDEENHRNVGGTILSLALDEIPAAIRKNHDNYSPEVIAILKAYYKKYYRDIVESV